MSDTNAEDDVSRRASADRGYALVLFDPDGNVRRRSGSAHLVGENAAGLFDPPASADSGPAPDAWFHAVLRGDVVFDVEGARTIREGCTTALAVSATPTFNRDGQVVGVNALIIDVGMGKRAEEGQQLLVEAGRVLASSLEAEETLRQAMTLFIPRLADWCVIFLREKDDSLRLASVAHSDPVLADFLRRLLERHHPRLDDAPALIGGVIRTGVGSFRPQGDAELRAMINTIAPELSDHLLERGQLGWMVLPLQARSRVLGAICFVSRQLLRPYEPPDLALAEELSRRLATAVDNAQLYAAARAAVEVRDGVLGIVAHDLRNPVGTIQMAADVLIAESIPDEMRGRYYGIIRRATDRMKHLIQDLLDVTGLEARGLQLDRANVDVAVLFDEVREMFAGQTEEKLQRLEFEAPPSLAPLYIDRIRMLQVFSNLIGNAVKFTPEGGRITVRATQEDGATQITVANTGPGLAAAELPHVFDRFWQSRRAQRGGAGLGLAITKGIVEAHGGRIAVESVPGEVTSFIFTIPDAPPPSREGRPSPAHDDLSYESTTKQTARHKASPTE